jgi:GTP-binding protein YchF
MQQLKLVERALELLQDGKPARTLDIDKDDEKVFKGLQLLTSKPILYVCNVDEESAATGNELTKKVAAMALEQGAESVVISARIEEEVAQLDDAEEKAEFLETLGLEETGLAQVIRAGYSLLGLITFFTQGPEEVRAWTISEGDKAPQAAGAIHGDFERGFICSETIAYNDFIALGGEGAAKEAGKMRQEGRDYIVSDGDLMLFRFNV